MARFQELAFSLIIEMSFILFVSGSVTYHPLHFAKHNHRLPMDGNILPIGIYYTYVDVGTPPRKFAVTIDTGSTDLLVPVAGCDGCMQNTSVYDLSSSTTGAIEGCNKTLTCQKCVVSVPSTPLARVSSPVSAHLCSLFDSYISHRAGWRHPVWFL